ncbi:MAG: choline kinase family protein [Capsulimonadales bacterium]|nr:choline kinase family protein [Capsulimonadales bacterium]
MVEDFDSEAVPAAVVALAAGIPLFAGASERRISPLSGVLSLNNANYRVDCDGISYLLRIGADTARHLGIRREEEIAAAMAAASVGVAPAVLYAEPSGVIVTSFVVGRHWEPEAFHEPQNLLRLAETLRRLHSVRNVTAEGSSFRRIERLLNSARSLGLELPSRIEEYRTRLAGIEAGRRSDPRFVPGLAHNDLWANNFLDDGAHLYLVDWEFAGQGDGLIDLATISMAGQYSEAEQRTLLAAYGLPEDRDYETLQTMKWVITFFEAGWALVMDGLRGQGRAASDIGGDFDYALHASRMFERLSLF